MERHGRLWAAHLGRQDEAQQPHFQPEDAGGREHVEGAVEVEVQRGGAGDDDGDGEPGGEGEGGDGEVGDVPAVQEQEDLLGGRSGGGERGAAGVRECV